MSEDNDACITKKKWQYIIPFVDFFVIIFSEYFISFVVTPIEQIDADKNENYHYHDILWIYFNIIKISNRLAYSKRGWCNRKYESKCATGHTSTFTSSILNFTIDIKIKLSRSNQEVLCLFKNFYQSNHIIVHPKLRQPFSNQQVKGLIQCHFVCNLSGLLYSNNSIMSKNIET